MLADGEPVPAQELHEALLHVGVEPPARRAVAREPSPQRGDAPAGRAGPRDRLVHLPEVQPLEVVCLVDRGVQHRLIDEHRQVDERARHRRDRDAVLDRDVRWRKVRQVGMQPLPTPALRARGDLDRPAVVPQDLPPARGAAMTQDGPVAARLHRGALPLVLRRLRSADEVHAAELPDERAGLLVSCHDVAREPGLPHLRGGHHPPLTPGEDLKGVRVTFVRPARRFVSHTPAGCRHPTANRPDCAKLAQAPHSSGRPRWRNPARRSSLGQTWTGLSSS